MNSKNLISKIVNLRKFSISKLNFKPQISRDGVESTEEVFCPEEIKKVENFLSNFSKEKIPVNSFQVTFSRSSGPGGQNVNKVNTKVDMRFNLYSSSSWLPSYVIRKLREQNSNRINKKGEITFASDRLRTQNQNWEDCLSKIFDAIISASKTPKEPTEEQMIKVQEHKEVAKEKNIFRKTARSSKKNERKKRDF
ncbi:hypothetical protein HDU92_006259 [Lobulomyces angularis]|nr:hypothetical protein HDU92_006259 [Lobulomyces angularis]